MASKIKLTISLSPNVFRELGEEARARKASRSAVVEEGVRLLRKKRLEELMARPAIATERDYGIGYG